MERPILNVVERKEAGKNPLKNIRNEGFVPGVIYGHNKENRNVGINKRELDRVLTKYGVGSSVELKVGDTLRPAIIKDIHRHITKQHVLHMDLQELDYNEKIRVKIPLYLLNKQVVESSVSVVQQQIAELEIQAFPQYLPQSIDVDVSNMKFGEPLKISELAVYQDENIQVLHDGEEIVALITTASKVEAAAATETTEDKLRKLY
ncbi:large subunit ribosomal protein L25 [Anaerosolibacter carboniphilus]|uniref:Large ribosomal subunit protein bL25 n=1 Tax=Anaerosolibacter carboniphilus TaxID=1417629 RepID=A0A841KZS6_9FIRM|nr:50S ribosomal protein L25 [Anaerosolibacter carboniphilus]MBB6218813.1 large subunit ribosomal protein L25 [Anaerosolibacter carboniphilus]